MKKDRKLLLVKILFLLIGVSIISIYYSASGWKRPVGIIIGIAAVLASLRFWKRKDFPFDPDEPITTKTKK